MNVLKPRQPAPNLQVKTTDGDWTLADNLGDAFTMVVFYRGLHCPICKTYAQELQRLAKDFEEKGVNILLVSSDTQDRAEQAKSEWKLPDITVGYGLSVEDARTWGLHRSAGRGLTSIGIEEPEEFSEPGLFLIKPDQTVYWANISTMPFARPHFREISGAIDFAISKDYPARGELS